MPSYLKSDEDLKILAEKIKENIFIPIHSYKKNILSDTTENQETCVLANETNRNINMTQMNTQMKQMETNEN